METVEIDAGRCDDKRPLARSVMAIGGVSRHGRCVAVAPVAGAALVDRVMLTVMVLYVGLVMMVVMCPLRRRR